MLERWRKLQRDFKHHKTGEFDVSKIPDIYDSIKYDAQHNTCLKSPIIDELYETSKIVADIVIPQEYGIEEDEKLNISHGYCVPLLRKILADLRANIDNPEEQLTKLDPSFVSNVLSPGTFRKENTFHTQLFRPSCPNQTVFHFRKPHPFPTNPDSIWRLVQR